MADRGGSAAVASEGSSGSWARKYAPAAVVLVGLLLAVTVLPSALNLPQTNPTEVAEYAPVPPTDRNVPPPGGDISSLGLASSAGETAQVGSQPAGDTGNTFSGVPKVPSTFRCVGNPPRQTEDPLSPPCVAYWHGDNYGATYNGVTGSDIKVVFYMDGEGCYFTQDEPNSEGSASVQPTGNTRPSDVFYDLDLPPSESSSDPNQPENGGSNPTQNPPTIYAAPLRIMVKYFNTHYQMYGRRIHMWLFHGRTGAGAHNCATPSDRKADSTELVNRIHPFSVINFGGTAHTSFNKDLAEDGVMAFSSTNTIALSPGVGYHESVFQSFPKLLWSFIPAVELDAHMTSNFICQRIAPYPVSFADDPGAPAQHFNGTKRVYGLIESVDPGYPEHKWVAEDIKSETANCGVNIIDTATFGTDGFNYQPGEDPTAARNAMSKFKSEGITTIIWGSGEENTFTAAAHAINYFPEWIFSGDRKMESFNTTTHQDQQELTGHVISVTTVTYIPSAGQQECYFAYVEAGGQNPALDREARTACGMYADLRELYTGIQVAGPRLNPDSVDAGYHAIPQQASKGPTTPACFYLTGDYTCVKDVTVEWYDALTRDPDGNQGCWHMFEGGRRYTLGDFSKVEAWGLHRQADPCNDYVGGTA